MPLAMPFGMMLGPSVTRRSLGGQVVARALSAVVFATCMSVAIATVAHAQMWREAAARVNTSARVLLIGTRPEDEDNALIAWLSLGRNVETAYLSLTRGESGGNVIGAEREAPLGVVRTAELLAERARDGAHQYFTRAYDFGPTRVDSIVDASWPHDSLLHDVVAVVRAFRPQIIIALNSAQDNRDATRRLTARLTAEAFAAAADTACVPSTATSNLPAWTASRLFTRIDSIPVSSGEPPVVMVNVGEFDRSTGRSFAELGADIRQLQRTQITRATPRIGVLNQRLRLDSSRVGDDTALFATIDTTMARFRGRVGADAEAQLDTLRADLAALSASAATSNATGDTLASQFARVAARTSGVRLALPCGDASGVSVCSGAAGDLAVTLTTVRERATRAMLAAAGVVIDGVAARELVAAADTVNVVTRLYNGGRAPVIVRRLAASSSNALSVIMRDSNVVVAPDSAIERSVGVRVFSPAYHWWQVNGLVSGTYLHNLYSRNRVIAELIEGEDRIPASRIEATVAIGGVEVPVIVSPIVYRSGSMARGDTKHPIAGVPPTSVILERVAEYERANLPIYRLFRVYVLSGRSVADTLAVTLRLPAGLKADSATRTVALPPFGARNVFFRITGKLPPSAPGVDSIYATARSVMSPPGSRGRGNFIVSAVAEFNRGFVTNEYPHIPSQQFVRLSAERLEAIDLRVPAKLSIAYVKGTDDFLAPLGQLRIRPQTIEPSLLSVLDLSGFNALVVGSDALANPALVAVVPTLQEFARNGGTVVVMPGRDEVVASGLLPYPIAFDSIAATITDATADVKMIDRKSQLLNWPNAITAADFDNWSDGRARGVPAAFDPRYQTVLSVIDKQEPGARPTTATVLIAHVGRGTIVYSALSLDRELIATTPGAARLFVNLLAIGMHPSSTK